MRTLLKNNMEVACAFCNIEKGREKVLETEYFFVILDRAPVNPGHALVISKRHTDNLFELNTEEWADMQTAIAETKKYLDGKFNPDAYNVGINNGEVAGQTVMHLHVHVIPRYKGDVKNPRGGIRNFKDPITDLLD